MCQADALGRCGFRWKKLPMQHSASSSKTQHNRVRGKAMKCTWQRPIDSESADRFSESCGLCAIKASALASLLALILLIAPAGNSQTSEITSQGQSAAATIRTTTRMVTLEVVVKDHKGNHITGLKPED